MAESLMRPQSAGAAILKTGSKIGGAALTPDVFMKVVSSQFQWSMSAVDTTGDGDQFAQVDHNNEWRGQISFNGFALASNHIGLQTLQVAAADADKNPVAVHFQLANDREYEFKMVITQIIVDWNRQAPVIGVAVRGMLTGNVTSNEAIGEV